MNEIAFVTEMPMLEHWIEDLGLLLHKPEPIETGEGALRITRRGEKRYSVEVRINGLTVALGYLWRDSKRENTAYLSFEKGDDAILYTAVFTYLTRNVVL
jgi:hypothetical protein